MSRHKRMRRVADHVQDRAADAARTLGESRRTLEEQQIQLDQLLNYREEYRQTLRQKQADGLNATRMLDYRQFMARLDQAIEESRATLKTLRHQMEHNRRLWLEQERKSRVLGKLVHEHQNREVSEMERREQRDSDDRFGQRMRRADG